MLGIILPTDELIFFRGVAKNHQPDGDFNGDLIDIFVAVIGDLYSD